MSEYEDRSLFITGMDVIMRPVNGPTQELKTVVLGATPVMVIDYKLDKDVDGGVRVEIDATGFENRDDIIGMLEQLADTLRDARITEATRTDAEGDTAPVDIVDRNGL